MWSGEWGQSLKNLSKWSLVRMAQTKVSTGENGKAKLAQVIMAPAI